MGEIFATQKWKSNAELIADAAKLGYLDGKVLDASYGLGVFWKIWKPQSLTTVDLYTPSDVTCNFRNLSFRRNSFDATVFDPPYRLAGRRDLGVFDVRYGIDKKTDRKYVFDDLEFGSLECYRVTRKYLLVKCQDQVESGKVRWQTDHVTRVIEERGGRKVDRFDLITTPRPQPKGRRQLTARRNSSTLLIFEKK
jgi:hypothetical protein